MGLVEQSRRLASRTKSLQEKRRVQSQKKTATQPSSSDGDYNIEMNESWEHEAWNRVRRIEASKYINTGLRKAAANQTRTNQKCSKQYSTVSPDAEEASFDEDGA